MAERPVGLGRVFLLASPLSPDWNTLPFKPAFLPFLHSLVAYLGQGPNRSLNVRVGEPLIWSFAGSDSSGSSGGGSKGIPAAGPWLLDGPARFRASLQPQPRRNPA